MYRVKSVIHGRGTRSSAGNSNCSVPYEYDPNLPENKSVAQLKLDLADRGIDLPKQEKKDKYPRRFSCYHHCTKEYYVP